MWPDKFPHLGPVLDGVPGQVDEKPKVVYRIRISQDKNFRKDVLTGERAWAFFNPFQCLAQGKWYWQHAYVTPEGTEEWSPIPFPLCQALERIEESPGTFTGKDIFPEILVLGDTNPVNYFWLFIYLSRNSIQHRT